MYHDTPTAQGGHCTSFNIRQMATGYRYFLSPAAQSLSLQPNNKIRSHLKRRKRKTSVSARAIKLATRTKMHLEATLCRGEQWSSLCGGDLGGNHSSGGAPALPVNSPLCAVDTHRGRSNATAKLDGRIKSHMLQNTTSHKCTSTGNYFKCVTFHSDPFPSLFSSDRQDLSDVRIMTVQSCGSITFRCSKRTLSILLMTS